MQPGRPPPRHTRQDSLLASGNFRPDRTDLIAEVLQNSRVCLQLREKCCRSRANPASRAIPSRCETIFGADAKRRSPRSRRLSRAHAHRDPALCPIAWPARRCAGVPPRNMRRPPPFENRWKPLRHRSHRIPEIASRRFSTVVGLVRRPTPRLKRRQASMFALLSRPAKPRASPTTTAQPTAAASIAIRAVANTIS